MENTQQYFGFKELNSVVIRAFKDITIGNKHFSEGEPILYFEKLQISNMSEKSDIVSARGGWGNYSQIIWENFNNVNFTLSEGVLSKTSFSILTNCEMFEYQEDSNIIQVPKREILTVDNNNSIKLLHYPLEKRLFIYILDDNGYAQERITDFNRDDSFITFNEDYRNKQVVIDYYFNYNSRYNKYMLSNKRIDGFLSLEGKAYFQDDKQGLKKTFLFEIPKMKITSNLDIILGEKASPNVAVFNIVGLPIKENNQFVVSKMYLLDDDIDSDI